jgi:hypothetical protein
MDFRYDEKNAAKLEEERKLQAEIDEEKSRKIFCLILIFNKSNFFSPKIHFTENTL